MMAKKRNRIHALLLCAVLLFQLTAQGIPGAFAQESTDPSLCSHHTQHTPECGFLEAVTAAPCTHSCGWDCYAKESICPHEEHDEECGYTEDIPEVPCGHVHTPECGFVEAVEAREAVPCDHTHTEGCGYVTPVEAREAVPCDHVHDQSCGENGAECTHTCGVGRCSYTPAVEASAGQPCGHVCGDGSCAYAEAAEAQEGAPCSHSCEDGACGYVPMVPGTPCGHEHSQDCYRVLTECSHVHDEACGYDETIPDSCTHSCDSSCQVPVIACIHSVHTQNCGYREEQEASPCSFPCSLCAAQEEFNAMLDTLPDPKTLDLTNPEQAEAANMAIGELISFALEKGLYATQEEVLALPEVSAVLSALYPVEPLLEPQALADNDIEAILYPTGTSASSGVALTTDAGSSISMSSGQNLLEIHWSFTKNEEHTLEITVPPGMYIVKDSWTPKNNDFQEVTFAPLNIQGGGEGGQGTGKYRNAQTGTLTYTTVQVVGETSAAETVTITMNVAFDQVLWDKKADGTSLTGSEPSVTVAMDTNQKVLYMGSVTTAEAVPWNVQTPSTSGMNTISLSDTPIRNNYFYILESNQSRRNYAFKSMELSYQTTVLRNSVVQNDISVPITDIKSTQSQGDKSAVPELTGLGTTYVTAKYTDYGDADGSIVDMGGPYLQASASTGLQGGDQIKILLTYRLETYSGRVSEGTAEVILSIMRETPKYIFQYFHGHVPSEDCGWYSTHADTVIDILGGFKTYNSGGAGQNLNLRFVFDANTPAGAVPLMKVYYANLIMPQGCTTDITVTLTDMSGTQQETTFSVTNNNESKYGYYLTAAAAASAAGLSGEWYLKAVEYTIAEVPATTYLYSTSGDRAVGSGGNFGGRLCTSARAVSTLSSNGAVQASVNTSQNIYPSHSSYIHSPSGDFTIIGGNSAAVSFQFQMYSYPYTNSTIMNNPTVIFVAPQGVSLSGVSYKKGGSTGAVSSGDPGFTAKAADADGNTVYIVQLGSGAQVGGITCGATGASISQAACTVTLNLSADISITADATYDLRDRLMITNLVDGRMLNNGMSGAAAKYRVPDLFDVDGDGNTSEIFSGLVETSTRQIVVDVLSSSLTVSTAVSTDLNSFLSGTRQDYVCDITAGDLFWYQVSVKNETGSQILETYNKLYIPVLKKDVTLPLDMGGMTPSFNTRLDGPVATDEYWHAEYSTDATAANYKTTATWTDSPENWDAVTMVRLSMTKEYPAAQSSTFLLQMQVKLPLPEEGDEASCTWSSALWRLFDDHRETYGGAGIYENTTYTRLEPMKNVIDWEVNTEYSSYHFFVTANGTPEQAVHTLNLMNAGTVNLYIRELIPNNFTLVPTTYFSENPDLSIADQDQTFAITMQFKDGSVVDLSDENAVNMLLGSTYDDRETPLLFSVSSYQNIIDGTSQRYLDLLLSDSLDPEKASIEINVRVEISRVLTQVEASTGILGGRYYNNIGTSATEATITQNSAFTAQFALENFYPSNYQLDQASITWSQAIPAGAVLLLIDQSEAGNVQYYGCTIGAATNKVLLSSFENLTDNATPFTIPKEAVATNKNFLLVADFSNCSLGVSSGDSPLKVALEMPPEGGGVAFKSELFVHVTPQKAISLAQGGSSQPLSGNSYAFTVGSTSGTDLKWQGRNAAIRFQLSGGSFPAGAFIRYNSDDYPVAAGQDYILVPIGDLSGKEISATLVTPYEKLDPASYTLTATLYVSNTADANAPLGGDQKGTVSTPFTVSAPAGKAAARIQAAGNKRLYTAQQAGSGISLTFTFQNISAGTGLTLVLADQQGAQSTVGTVSATGSSQSYTLTRNLTEGAYLLLLKDSAGNTLSKFSFIIVD